MHPQLVTAGGQHRKGLVMRWLLAALLLVDFTPASWADDSGGHHHDGGGNSSGPPPGFNPLPITRGSFEVWLSDQANTVGLSLSSPTGTHGGKVRIYDSADLLRPQPINNPIVLDATLDLFPNALQATNSHTTRLHGIMPSPDFEYMALNFVSSGHLGIVHGPSKQPVCLFRSTGTSTGRQNHMSFWTPNGNHIIVGNQNGRMLERVDVIRHTSGAVKEFVFNASSSLDFVGGSGRVTAQPIAVTMDSSNGIGCRVEGAVPDNQTSLTPANRPKQAPGIRPLNSVICPIPSSSGKHVFATLGGGGMFVVDVSASPMAIVAEYDLSIMNAAGCGGIETQGYMHMDTGTSGAGVSEFSVYRFGVDYPLAPNYLPPNSPLPIAVWQDPDNGKLLPGNNRDAHGMVVIDDELHVFDRVRNTGDIFHMHEPWNILETHDSYDLTESQACGTTLGATTSNDPTPDLGDASPEGDMIFVALRGPFPLTVSHAAAGSCPGLGIIVRDPITREWRLAHVLPSTVLDFSGSINLSDPHAVIVRRNGAAAVPGPLPLLGLGMGLAWSRRLRKRLQKRASQTQG
jgi:hypothetical protein